MATPETGAAAVLFSAFAFADAAFPTVDMRA